MNTCICHTAGCGNEDAPIEMELSFEMDGETQWVTVVFCGVCGQEITDITPPIGESAPEPQPTKR